MIKTKIKDKGLVELLTKKDLLKRAIVDKSFREELKNRQKEK